MRASWAIETFSPIVRPAAVVEIGAAVDEGAGADLQAADVEEAHPALQRRRTGDLEAGQAIEQRPQRERQATVQQVDRRQAEEVELRTDPVAAGLHGGHAGSASAGGSDRPTAKYSRPKRPSSSPVRRGCGRRRPPASFSAVRIASKSGLRNSFHSVTMTSASAPSSASCGESHDQRASARAPQHALALRRRRDRVVGADASRRARTARR